MTVFELILLILLKSSARENFRNHREPKIGAPPTTGSIHSSTFKSNED